MDSTHRREPAVDLRTAVPAGFTKVPPPGNS
jgi:hypothetical protein